MIYSIYITFILLDNYTKKHNVINVINSIFLIHYTK